MIILPDNNLSDLYPKDSGIVLSKKQDPLILGPIWSQVNYHSLIEWFLIIGKILRLRELADYKEGESGDMYEYKQWLTAFVDQSQDGEVRDYDFLETLNRGVARFIPSLVNQINNFIIKCDDAILKMFEGWIVKEELFLDKRDPIENRVALVIQYMATNDIALELSDDGFFAYFQKNYRDLSGPANFPTSTFPTVLDEWITSEVINLEEIT